MAHSKTAQNSSLTPPLGQSGLTFSDRVKTARFARQIHFSCGHRYAVKSWSEEKNKEVFGSLFAPGGFGHNFICEARFSGPIDEATGMVLNLATVDVWLKEVTDHLDHRFLNIDLAAFDDAVPSLENVSRWIWGQLFERAGEMLQTVCVYEDEKTWCVVETNPTGAVLSSAPAPNFAWDKKPVLLVQQYSVSCLHRHHNPDLTQEENEKLYMKCSRTHGHRYLIEVGVMATPDAQSGLAIRRDKMNAWVKQAVIDPLHGQYLNDVMGNTSGELILLEFDRRLRAQAGDINYAHLAVRETRKNHFILNTPVTGAEVQRERIEA